MRLTRIPFNKLASLINSYSNYNPSPLSLQKLADFGKNIHHVEKGEFRHIEIKSYEFLKEELLVRLAQMSKEMLYLPDKLIKTSSVQMVYSWYIYFISKYHSLFFLFIELIFIFVENRQRHIIIIS
jgi:hypothetical protein